MSQWLMELLGASPTYSHPPRFYHFIKTTDGPAAPSMTVPCILGANPHPQPDVVAPTGGGGLGSPFGQNNPRARRRLQSFPPLWLMVGTPPKHCSPKKNKKKKKKKKKIRPAL
eukprot:FR736014.1.p2 GENE.FR736014.1~~FR736014.1.p2  ORF type:complete len:113 (+),score=35.09 FR736014.1:723-1061(+)